MSEPSRDATRIPRILYVDDEVQHAEAAADSLRVVDYVVDVAHSGEQALELLRGQPYDLLITDLVLGDMDGLSLMREARTVHPFLGIIMITGHGSIESAVEAMRRGAVDYMEKPVDIKALRIRVRKALDDVALRRRTDELERRIDVKFGFEGIIGSSPNMHAVIERLTQIAPTDVSVLILGESGTGKELIAKALHTNSRRKDKPFVPLNCATLSGGTLESELFGHMKGAFTGATYTRKGRIEHAHGGSLFLDEVGDIPLDTQVKLLRVVEERNVTRIGSNDPLPVDVRIICATHRPLKEMVDQKLFREDLYYRLNVVQVELPALRERTVDIPLLVNHFMNEYARIHQKNVEGISRETLRILTRYPWPGNVRELKNALENMVVTAQGPELMETDLPGHIYEPDGVPHGGLTAVGTTIEELERELIRNTLASVGGHRKQAAVLLGIGERTLYRKIAEYHLHGA